MNFENLRQFLDQMARTHTPGNAVQVRLDGKTVFQYASGCSDLENRIPMTGGELLNLYSCSKLTTVTAGMQLLERGEYLLTDPLYEYLPAFRHMTVRHPDGSVREAENPITVGDLFTMTAGFSYNLEAPGFQKARALTGGHMHTVRAVECLAEDPLEFEPGTHWRYSLCHDVLAALIEVVSGQKFREYVQEHIFDPLEMLESGYHRSPEILQGLAPQYRFESPEDAGMDEVEAQISGCAKNGVFVPIGTSCRFVLGDEYDSGGAGIYSTLEDYSRLLAALARKGTGANGERILSPFAVELMRTNRLSGVPLEDYNWATLRGCGYGLGVRVHLDPAKSGVLGPAGEFGWSGAAGSCAFMEPETGLSVFYTQHTLNPREPYYQPRLRNVVYSCLR